MPELRLLRDSCSQAAAEIGYLHTSKPGHRLNIALLREMYHKQP